MCFSKCFRMANLCGRRSLLSALLPYPGHCRPLQFYFKVAIFGDRCHLFHRRLNPHWFLLRWFARSWCVVVIIGGARSTNCYSAHCVGAMLSFGCSERYFMSWSEPAGSPSCSKFKIQNSGGGSLCLGAGGIYFSRSIGF